MIRRRNSRVQGNHYSPRGARSVDDSCGWRSRQCNIHIDPCWPPLAQLDIKDAEIAPARGVPKGTFTIAQHFALDPTWLDPQDHIVALTQQHYDYLVHDAMVKTMP